MLLEFITIEKTGEPNTPLIGVNLVMSSERKPNFLPIELTLHGHDIEDIGEFIDTSVYLNVSKDGARQLADMLLEMSND